MTRKKYIYVGHPYRGDPEQNIKAVTDICRALYKKDPNVIPISALHLFSWMDPNEDVIDVCYDLIDFSGDNVSFYGDWSHSEGCMKEAEYHWDKVEEKIDSRFKKVMWVLVLAVLIYFLGLL